MIFKDPYYLEACKYFKKMQLTCFILDSITFTSILLMCSTLVALKWELDIHRKITRCDFLSHAIMIIILVDMYVKYKSIKMISVLFDKMHL